MASGERWLEGLEGRAEALLRALGEAELARLREPAAPPCAAVWERHAGLGHPEVFSALEEALPGAGEPARRRSIEGLLELAATVAERVAAAPAALRRDEVEAGLRVEADGEEVAYRGLPALIRESGEPRRRRALEEALARGAAEVEGLAAEELARARDQGYRLGGDDPIAFRSRLLRYDVAALGAEAERVLDVTDDAAAEALPWLLRDHVDEPGRGRLSDLLRATRAPGLDGLLPAGDLLRVDGTFERLGLDPRAGGRLRRDLAPALSGPAWVRAVAVEVPEEVHLVGATGAGLPAYRAMLGELGRGLHAAGVAASRSVADRRLRDGSLAEGFALLFAALVQSPPWTRRVLRLSRPDADRLVRTAAAVSLVAARRAAARLLHELALARGEPEAGDRFVELGRRASGVEVPRQLWLVEVDPGLGAARLVLAHLFEALAHEALRERYDEDWFLNPRAGERLRALFAEGRARDLHVLAEEELGRPLAAEALGRRYEELLG